MYLQEIERKFAVATVPSPVSNFTTKVIVQSYLAFDDEEVVRVRALVDAMFRNPQYEMTIKRYTNIPYVRDEVNMPIGEHLFNALARASLYQPLTKYRTTFTWEGTSYVLDRYTNEVLKDIPSFVEVEFDTAWEADSFTKPAWLGEEVYFDALALWKRVNIYERIRL